MTDISYVLYDQNEQEYIPKLMFPFKIQYRERDIITSIIFQFTSIIQ